MFSLSSYGRHTYYRGRKLAHGGEEIEASKQYNNEISSI